MIKPQQCPVYLKHPLLDKVSQNFAKRVSEKISQVFSSFKHGSVHLSSVKWNIQRCSIAISDCEIEHRTVKVLKV